MNDKNHQELFEEYQNLTLRTRWPVNNIGFSGETKPIVINPEDLIKRNQLREELRNNLKLLTDEQLKELYNDSGLMEDAVKILAQRKLD